jgi:hypothetical protein
VRRKVEDAGMAWGMLSWAIPDATASREWVLATSSRIAC